MGERSENKCRNYATMKTSRPNRYRYLPGWLPFTWSSELKSALVRNLKHTWWWRVSFVRELILLWNKNMAKIVGGREVVKPQSCRRSRHLGRLCLWGAFSS
jgi:hypothetical protein